MVSRAEWPSPRKTVAVSITPPGSSSTPRTRPPSMKQTRHARRETKVGAAVGQSPPHPAHHRRQQIAADVRFGVVENRPRCAAGGEDLEDLAHPRVADRV